MRILTVNTHEHGGGAEKVARDLTAGVKRQGWETVLAVGFKHSEASDVVAIPRSRDYRPRNPAAVVPSERPRIAAAYASGLEDIYFPGIWDLLELAGAPPDLVHIHNMHGGYFDLRVLPWLSHAVPTVLTLHDAWTLSGHCAHSFACERWRTGCGDCPDLTIYPPLQHDGSAANWARKRQLYRDSALHVVTPCHWLMGKVRDGILAEGMAEGRVIRQGTDLSVFHPGDRTEARRQLGLPADATILLFAANGIRANPWKDYAGLCAVLERLGDQLAGQRLMLVGLGEDSPPETIGMAEINFVPLERDPARVAAYFRAADLYLHMARAETSPNVITEALCCGTPVAATSVGGIGEQVNGLALPWMPRGHGVETATGVLVGLGEVDEMVEALRHLLADRVTLGRLGLNAAEDGRRRFDFRRTVAEYMDFYRFVAERFAARQQVA